MDRDSITKSIKKAEQKRMRTTLSSRSLVEESLISDRIQKSVLIRNGAELTLKNISKGTDLIVLCSSLLMDAQFIQYEPGMCSACQNEVFNWSYNIVSHTIYTNYPDQLKQTNCCVAIFSGKGFCEVIYQAEKLEEVGTQIQGRLSETHSKDRIQIYVTKVIKKLKERTSMNGITHDDSWKPKELAQVMENIQKRFGSFASIISKKRSLIFEFEVNQNLRIRSDRMRRQFLFSSLSLQDKNIFCYYIVSKDLLPGSNDHHIHTISKGNRIVDIALAHPWIIVAIATSLLFVHIQYPMDQHHIETDLRPVKLTVITMESKIKIIVFLEDCRAIIYKQVKDQIEFGFAIETTFVVPHCLAIQKQGLMIAGIDVEPAGFFSQASHKRSRKVYLINNFTLLTNKSRLLKYDTSIHILDIADENQKHIPIKSIHWIEDERILISAWHNKIYVHDTLSMSNKNTTQLLNPVLKCVLLQFPFNLCNLLVSTRSGEIIRIGYEALGAGIAAEVVKYSVDRIIDFGLTRQNSSDLAMMAFQKRIAPFDYHHESQERPVISFQTQGATNTILRMESDHNGIVYLLAKDGEIQVRYFQF